MKFEYILFSSFILTLFLATYVVSQSEFGAGVGVSPWDRSAPKKKEEKKADLYIKKISEHFNMEERELERFWKRGYGRNELIKLLLISKKGKKDFTKIVKQREKNIKLSRMAEKYKVDYEQVLEEAAKIREEIDYQVSISTPIQSEVRVSTGSIILYSSQDYKNKVSTDTNKGR